MHWTATRSAIGGSNVCNDDFQFNAAYNGCLPDCIDLSNSVISHDAWVIMLHMLQQSCHSLANNLLADTLAQHHEGWYTIVKFINDTASVQ